MPTYECSKCNQPVGQPCCRVETAPLKAGCNPVWCPLTGGIEAKWKRVITPPPDTTDKAGNGE